jgi:hypothetical protein
MSDKPETGFVPLTMLKGTGPRQPEDIIAEIRRIYFKTAKPTIENDFAHAIELLKQLPDEDTREKAHVYMEGLAEMRKEWLRPDRKSKNKHQK